MYIYLRKSSPLQLQKNNRELENIVQECIMMAIRESIPTEAIIRAYMDENVEHEEQVFIEDVEESKEENNENKQTEKEDDDNVEDEDTNKEEESIPEVVPSIQNIDNEDVVTKLTFNDMDSVLEEDNKVNEIEAPKSLERLEDISVSRMLDRKLEEEPKEDPEESEDEERIQISTEPVDLSGFDVIDDSIGKVSSEDILLNDVQEPPPL